MKLKNIKDIAELERSHYNFEGFISFECPGCRKRLTILRQEIDFKSKFSQYRCVKCGFYIKEIQEQRLWKQPDYGFKSSEIYEAHQMAVGGEEFE